MSCRRRWLAVSAGAVIAVVAAVLMAGCSVSAGRHVPAGTRSATASGSSAVPTPQMSTLTSGTGQAELLLRPPGAVRGLVVFMHGLYADQNQLLDSPALIPVRNALLQAGYAIISSTAHGNNFGNPASVQDQVAALEDARARLPGVRDVDILAFSMGGFDALLAASAHVLPGLRSVALLSPAVDQTSFLDGPYGPQIAAAFGHPMPAQVPATIAQSDPLNQPASSYAGYRYHFWHSPEDRTVPSSQSTMMASHLASSGIAAPVTRLTGDHGDLSTLDPQAVVRLFSDTT